MYVFYIFYKTYSIFIAKIPFLHTPAFRLTTIKLHSLGSVAHRLLHKIPAV